MAFNYSPKIITDGLVLYLDAANTRSYPTTGTIWSDLSRNNNNGTLINGPTFNSANGGSIVFDGVNDFVITPSPYSLNGGTLNVWVRRTGLGSNGNTITGSFGGSGNQRSPTIYGTTTIQWEFGSLFGRNTGIPFTINVWYNITLTYNNSFIVRVYVNGNLIASDTSLNPGGFWVNETFGRYGNFGSIFFQGNITQVSIYNRALSAQEVLQNYNATKSRFGLT
jgi:hypothetical protein